jgi:tRNA-dihydrouridine synthase B
MAMDGNAPGVGLFERSRVCLAPMAGYGEAPFRLLCSELGADFTFTGMVSADGLGRRGRKSFELLRRLDGEAPLGIQLFGANPETLARAAGFAEDAGATFVDLNFGCPVKKVIRKNGGAAIMRDLDLMERIVREVVSAVSVPVTAKIRSGWSEAEQNYLEAGETLERAGASAVTLHPRSRSAGFTGTARWESIRALRERLSIPVIANGDITSAADYREMARVTGCTLAMIGRGALGNPWIFREIVSDARGLGGGEVGPAELFAMVERHLLLEAAFMGEWAAVRSMRRFYRWYLRAYDGARRWRVQLCMAGSVAEVRGIIDDLRKELGIHGGDTAQAAS